MLQMFVLALSLYNTWNRGVFLLCKITNLLIYSYKNEFVDFISIRSSLVTKKQIQAAHEYGKAIHVWTVNSRSEIEQMALMGVDNIITDYPTRAKEVLYQPDVAKNLLTYIRQVMK